MELFPAEIIARLIENGRKNAECIAEDRKTLDFKPVVKLFTPDAGCTWLLTELAPEDVDVAFGLCDLGFGFPELGSVRISEIRALRGKLGLPVERDLFFTATKTLGEYAAEASRLGRIRT